MSKRLLIKLESSDKQYPPSYIYKNGIRKHFNWCDLWENWVDTDCCKECDKDAGESNGAYRICPYRGKKQKPPVGQLVNQWKGG